MNHISLLRRLRASIVSSLQSLTDSEEVLPATTARDTL